MSPAEGWAVTVGAGRTRPRGRRVALTPVAGPVAALVALLDALPPAEVEGWWAPALFEGEHRKAAGWRGALAVGVDVDNHDESGAHAPLQASVRAVLDAAAARGELPGSIYHASPRGLRLVFVFAEPESDAARWDAAAAGAVSEVQKALRALALYVGASVGGAGLAVDEGASKDRARFYYRHRCIVGGVRRDAPLVVLREPAYAAGELARLAPAPPPRTLAAVPVAPLATVKEAAAAFNRAHPGEWPRMGGTCPACGHKGCFGTLPDDPARWYCHSDRHEVDGRGCGRRGTKGWHGDALDLAAHAAGCGRVELLRREGLLASRPTRGAGPRGDARDPAKPSKATALVRLACEHAVLFHATDRTAYADVLTEGLRATWPVESPGFRDWLEGLYFAREGKAAGRQALGDALGTLGARARYGGAMMPVHLRVAPGHDVLYIDLCNERWEAVEVRPEGWRVVAAPPVRFRRARGMHALPVPQPGGSLDALRGFVPLEGGALRLLVAWLVAALAGQQPFPALVLQGEQGCGKSLLSRTIRDLVDPNEVPLCSPPKDERDLAIAARNGWIAGFDNLSGLDGVLSDALCRLTHGGGFRIRQLYSNDEEALFKGARPVLLNGIGRIVTRADLEDRCIVLHLPVLPDARRRPEGEYAAAFEAARPALFGALLDALAGVLRVLPSVHLAEHPRMADFARVGTAAEGALGWPVGSFRAAYAGKRAEAVREGLDSDPVGSAVLALLRSGASWEGTATDLLVALAREAGEDTVRRSPAWPRDAAGLGKRMERLAPSLRAVGVEWTTARTSARRLCRLRQGSPPAVTPVTPVTGATAGPLGPAGSGDGLPLRLARADGVLSPAEAGSDANDGSDGTDPALAAWPMDPLEDAERAAIQAEGA